MAPNPRVLQLVHQMSGEWRAAASGSGGVVDLGVEIFVGAVTVAVASVAAVAGYGRGAA